jgi:hypothetical protein
MVKNVIRYPLYGKAQSIPGSNFKLGTWNLEPGTLNLCHLSSVSQGHRVVGSYGRSVNSVIGQLVNS